MGSITVPAGPAAVAALAERVRAAQAGDPLAPVTVVTPSRRSALALRRELASGRVGGTAGIVNVRFEIVDRLVELLVEGLGNQRRLRPPVLREAVRQVLAMHPGHLGSAASHPATIERVAQGYEEVRRHGPAARDGLAKAGTRGRALAELYARVDERLVGWADDAALAARAAATLRKGGGAATELGELIWFSPDLSDPAIAALVTATPDATVLTLAPPPLDELAEGTTIVSLSDPDDEARHSARAVAALAEQGVPLHRIAVLHPGQRYARLVHQHLERAGIPHHGPAVRTLAQTPAGLALQGLLELAADDLSRDHVFQWLVSAPIVDPATGEAPPRSLWDVESRRAGVLGGLDQWQTRLQHRIDRLEEATDPDHHDPRVDADLALQTFVQQLAEVVGGAVTQPWPAWSAWATDALRTYLRPRAPRGHWADDQVDAYEHVLEVVDQLAALDAIEPGARIDPARFAAALAAQLDVPAGRTGTFGDGVYLGSILSMAGLCADAVIVVGAAEGLLPRGTAVDPLLGDLGRERAGLPPLGGTADDQQRDFALALATADQRVVTWPRGDLRASAAYLPSRWVVDLAGALAGEPVSGEALIEGSIEHPAIRHVASFADGLAHFPSPADAGDRRLAELWHGGTGAVLGPAVLADPLLRAAFGAEQARALGGFSEFDGRLDPAGTELLAEARTQSATSLQTYARCPRQYLFSRVLGLRQIDRPEAIDDISPLERGSLVHLVLERWVRDRIDGVPGADTDEHLMTIADEAFAEAEELGITGRPLQWASRKRTMRRELLHVAHVDRKGAMPAGNQPLAVEMTFGRDDEPPLVIDLPTQGPIKFAGSVDRVARTTDGALVVADYKTGKASDYANLEKAPVKEGQLLQLPLYARAARERFGTPDTRVSAHYWFITDGAKFVTRGYDLTPEIDRIFTDTVDVIVDGIRAGRFPGHPGAYDYWHDEHRNCHWCEFDKICPTGRGGQWERSSSDPALETYVELTTGARADGAEP
ncbi:MAG TPA: PD-(D/E)XK nuclease family protein [Acidimicrobiales bacterium]|jgi:RecB family exonuclease|nr:PD-(D/E)XK nuclease family protein [Acidimicrobiales bacterium]